MVFALFDFPFHVLVHESLEHLLQQLLVFLLSLDVDEDVVKVYNYPLV